MQWAASSPLAGLGYLVRQAVRSGWDLSNDSLRSALATLRPYRLGPADEPLDNLFQGIVKEVDRQQRDADIEDIEDFVEGQDRDWLFSHSQVSRDGRRPAACHGFGGVRSDRLADLVAAEDGRFKYELDLEVIVYGRNYRGKKVGPYMRLLTFDPGETVIREGAWGGNTFYIVVKGQPEVLLRSVGGEDVKVSEIPPG